MNFEKDYIGLGLRIDLAEEITKNINKGFQDVECLEIIAEDYYKFNAKDTPVKSMSDLAKYMPISLHGVTLGMASATNINLRLADGMARLVEAVDPIFWSEHLSFVRGGGAEIGHLAAAPRNNATVDGTLRNIEALAKHIGARPVVENIATLITPPCSSMPETTWLSSILNGSDTYMLLDLHNLLTNAKNSGLDPFAMLDELPLDRVRQIHLAGGVDIPAPGGGTRLLDDHVHDVPKIVFDLLEAVGRKTANNLMVIIERDGRYPDFNVLIEQLRNAKLALKSGRNQRKIMLKNN